MDKWNLIVLVTSLRQLLMSCSKQIQPTLAHLHRGLPSGFFHSGFSISYTLTRLHPGLPSDFFHSVFPVFLPVRATFPVHLILLDSVNGANHVPCQCATFFYPSFTYSCWEPRTFPNTYSPLLSVCETSQCTISSHTSSHNNIKVYSCDILIYTFR
jgi:hypothetical protein